MFKMIFTAIALSFDFELEKQCIDRISFRKFLGFPEYIPDSTTVWSFRKKINDNCKENKKWIHLQSQLNCLGLKIKKRMILDVTFIHSDPGNSKVDKPRENEAKNKEKQRLNMDKKGW